MPTPPVSVGTCTTVACDTIVATAEAADFSVNSVSTWASHSAFRSGAAAVGGRWRAGGACCSEGARWRVGGACRQRSWRRCGGNPGHTASSDLPSLRCLQTPSRSGGQGQRRAARLVPLPGPRGARELLLPGPASRLLLQAHRRLRRDDQTEIGRGSQAALPNGPRELMPDQAQFPPPLRLLPAPVRLAGCITACAEQ